MAHARKNLVRLVLLSVLAISAGILVKTYWYTMTVPKAVQEDDIREAVLRDFFSDSMPGRRPPREVFCVSFADVGNPGAALLERFRGHRPPVVQGSECPADKTGSVAESKTGRSASIYQVAAIQWFSRFDAETQGYVSCGHSCAAIATFRIHWEKGHWEVRSIISWLDLALNTSSLGFEVRDLPTFREFHRIMKLTTKIHGHGGSQGGKMALLVA